MASAQKLPQDEQAERSKLIAFENAWNQAQIHRDGEALNLLMGDRYIFTKWDGTLMNKATFIPDNKNQLTNYALARNVYDSNGNMTTNNNNHNVLVYDDENQLTRYFHYQSSPKGVGS